jgi:hypothetical protein
MEVIEGPLIEEGKMGIVEQTPEQIASSPKPAFQPAPALDEAMVRAAVEQAEASGADPMKLRISDMAQIPTPQQQPKAVQAETPVEVPEKFKKPNGEVDVEKLNASTRQIDEALQKKQEVQVDMNKFVEDQLKAYKEKERQLRSMPSIARQVAQVVPPAPTPMSNPAELSNEQLEAMINQDIQQNPARTIANLVQMALQRELQPIHEEKKDGKIRGNLRELAERDPRVVAHIAAINAKIDENPEMLSLKNPYKSAWLEVREDLRLGELSQAQAQPSKPVAPVLGGGTPPPSPSSSSGVADVNAVLQASKVIGQDPRNKGKFDNKQWDKLDAIARQIFNK